MSLLPASIAEWRIRPTRPDPRDRFIDSSRGPKTRKSASSAGEGPDQVGFAAEPDGTPRPQPRRMHVCAARLRGGSCSRSSSSTAPPRGFQLAPTAMRAAPPPPAPVLLRVLLLLLLALFWGRDCGVCAFVGGPVGRVCRSGPPARESSAQAVEGGQHGEALSDRSIQSKYQCKAVLIPGFVTDASAFLDFAERLNSRGVRTVVAPIRWYQWLPTVGDRSMRPILDRIHETVMTTVAADPQELQRLFHRNEHEATRMTSEVAATSIDFDREERLLKLPPYSLGDWVAEMIDPTKGAHHGSPFDTPSCLSPSSRFPSTDDDKVVLIAHSAAGWISRIYLSDAEYGGRVYIGSNLVRGLVTLGTPHMAIREIQDGRQPLNPRNMGFVLNSASHPEGGKWEDQVPVVCVGGDAVRGEKYLGGLAKTLPFQSYELVCGDGSGSGDGITPLTSALGMDRARSYITLPDCFHGTGFPGDWYGSDSIIDQWLAPALAEMGFS